MTVCIAAICLVGGVPMIVGASDRMITSGDTEYEPMSPKIWWIGPKIVALTAGDAAIQGACYNQVRSNAMGLDVGVKDVKQIADDYAQAYLRLKRAKAEVTILQPVGLTFSSFLQQQAAMSNEVVREIQARLRQFDLEFETIIAGLDQDGSAHIYVIKSDGDVQCYDSIGFAAIGYGANHAESEFMAEGYASWWPYEAALFLTYAAKRRAEKAPGVGFAEDVFFIDKVGDFVVFLPNDQMEKLRAIYSERREQHYKATMEAQTEVFKYVEELRKAQSQPPERQIQAIQAQLEQERVREGAQEGEPTGETEGKTERT